MDGRTGQAGVRLPNAALESGFFDRVLRSKESYEEKWHYVVNNPVRAGLVEHAHEWPHQGVLEALD